MNYKKLQKLFGAFDDKAIASGVAGGLIMEAYDPLECENASSNMIKDYARMIQACCKENLTTCENNAQDCESCGNCETKCTD